MEIKVKPCPFCGSNEVGVWATEFATFVKCWDCLAKGAPNKDGVEGDEIAVKAWNIRKEPK